MAYLMRRDGVSLRQADRLGRIEDAGQHLVNVINDILDLSRIEAGRIVLEAIPVRSADSWPTSPRCWPSRRGPEAANPGGPRPVARQPGGRSHRLKQALLNYAANAVKFTEQGESACAAARWTRTKPASSSDFEVEDSGPGIALEVQGKLFHAFEQADTSTTRKHGGTGLGLAITAVWPS